MHVLTFEHSKFSFESRRLRVEQTGRFQSLSIVSLPSTKYEDNETICFSI